MAVAAQDAALQLYSSGTTGLPKGVPLPSFVELMSAHDVIMHFPLTPWDRTLNMTPWFHRGGLHSGGLNPTFYVGGSVVPMREFDPETVLNWVGEYNITFLIGAPTVLERLARAQEKNPRDLSNLRGIVTMGAPYRCSLSSTLHGCPDPEYFQWLRHDRDFLEHVLTSI